MNLISIGTNASALMAQAATASVQIDAETAMQRLSSGRRINAAKDDAAGVAIASRMTSHVRGLHQSIRNSMDAQALIGTAEGGLQETEALLQRIRELAVQASNDTNSDADRTNLNNEAQQLLAGIDAIASETTWAGQNLLDGTYSNKSFHVGGGSLSADTLTSSIQATDSENLGLNNISSPIVPQKAGPEFLINSYLTGDQGNPATRGPNSAEPVIAAHSDGNYVVIWNSDGQDGSSLGLFGQLFNLKDEAIGDEFAINTTVNGNQHNPDVDFFADGSFIVCWQNMASANSGINAQIFSNDGQKIGCELVIRSTTDVSRYAERVPSIVTLADDKMLVTWSSFQHYSGGNSYEVYGQIISNAGIAQGAAFQINTQDQGNQSESDVQQLSDGNIVVAYTDYFGLTNAGQSGVYAQIIDQSGSQVGSEIEIYFENNLDAYDVELVALKQGGFAASWTLWDQSTTDYKLYTSVFDNSGSQTSSPTHIETSNVPPVSSMLQLENGGYLLAYSNSSDGGSTSSILIREMNSSGESVTEDFEVSSNLSLLNQAPKLALSENDLIVTWVSSGIDGSGNGIAGQRLLLNNSSASIAELNAARSMITNVDTALQTLNYQRASLGALSNRLDHIIANNTNASSNTKASLGRIQDADFAAETTKLAKSKILEQSSTAMLAQANASVYEVLTLISY